MNTTSRVADEETFRSSLKKLNIQDKNNNWNFVVNEFRSKTSRGVHVYRLNYVMGELLRIIQSNTYGGTASVYDYSKTPRQPENWGNATDEFYRRRDSVGLPTVRSSQNLNPGDSSVRLTESNSSMRPGGSGIGLGPQPFNYNDPQIKPHVKKIKALIGRSAMIARIAGFNNEEMSPTRPGKNKDNDYYYKKVKYCMTFDKNRTRT